MSVHARMARSPTSQNAASHGAMGSLAAGGLATPVVLVVLRPNLFVPSRTRGTIPGIYRGARWQNTAETPLACPS